MSGTEKRLDGMKWLRWHNAEFTECPPFGVVMLNALNNTTGGLYFTGLQWDHTNLLAECAINGPSRVAAGAYGICTLEKMVTVSCDITTNNNTSPHTHQRWGAEDNNWQLARNGYDLGFEVRRIENILTALVIAIRDPVWSFVGTSQGLISGGGTGDVAYDDPGDFFVTARNKSFHDIPGAASVICWWDQLNQEYVAIWQGALS